MFPIILAMMMVFAPRKNFCLTRQPALLAEKRISYYMNAILSYRCLSGIERNKYIFYLSEVERRIIHSDDYQEMGSKAEGSSLPMNLGFKGNVTQKEDYHFFPLLSKDFR